MNLNRRPLLGMDRTLRNQERGVETLGDSVRLAHAHARTDPHKGGHVLGAVLQGNQNVFAAHDPKDPKRPKAAQRVHKSREALNDYCKDRGLDPGHYITPGRASSEKQHIRQLAGVSRGTAWVGGHAHGDNHTVWFHDEENRRRYMGHIDHHYHEAKQRRTEQLAVDSSYPDDNDVFLAHIGGNLQPKKSSASS